MLPFQYQREIEYNPRPWMEKYTFELVTEETLTRVVNECIAAGIYALDLETTGLDTRVFPVETENGTQYEMATKIVGVCLSAGNKTGYYIPLRHRPLGKNSPHNIPFDKFDRAFRRLMDSGAQPVVHNCKYEGEILSFPGGEPYGKWDDPTWWEDTQILGYLANSTRKRIGLKAMSQEDLGKEQIEIDELFPPKTKRMNFAELDPENEAVLAYACSDAICTIELCEKHLPEALILPSTDASGRNHHQKHIYMIEKLCVPAIRWMERARLPIDLELVAKFIHQARVELLDSLRDVYKGASDILGRDITPLSFYLLEKELKENDTWETLEVSEDLNAPTLQSLFTECKDRAKRVQTQYAKRNLKILKDCENDPYLKNLLTREAPPPKKFNRNLTMDLQSEYDALSPGQMGLLLFDLGVKGLVLTETNQIKTDKEILDSVIEDNETEMPFMKKIKVFRGNNQALKNLINIWRDTDRRDNSLKISFRAYAAGTGRFSSKGDGDRAEITGGTRFNLQSMPAGKDPRSPEALLRIREVIRAREGKIMVVIDFSGVELRISANLSREKLWIEQFFKCSSCDLEFPRGDGKSTPPAPPKYCPQCGSDKIGDIHTLTALQIYGQDAMQHELWGVYRGRGKNTNFALNYGGGAGAVQRQTGVNKQEAHRIVNKFKDSYRYIQKFWETRWAFAQEHKYVLTAFMRKFPLPDIKHAVSWIRGKSERNAINSPIQGTSADITKLAMGMLFQRCKERDWLEKIHMLLTMHDELVFEVDVDILEEAINMIVETMVSNDFIMRKKWPVPYTVDVELGKTWKAKINLYEVQYMVALRKRLQKPGQTDAEIQKALRCVRGFLGSPEKVREKYSSFEDMVYPELIRPYFKEGREDVLTQEEKDALRYAWELYHGGSPQPQSVSTEEPLPKEAGAPAIPDAFTYQLKAPLTIKSALALASVVFKSRGTGTRPLRVLSSKGKLLQDWTETEVHVDPERFTQLAQENHV